MGESARLTVKEGTESRQRARVGVVIPYFLMRDEIAARRRGALGSALHMLRRRHNVVSELAYLLRSDPTCAASWCVDLPKLLFTKASGRPFTVD